MKNLLIALAGILLLLSTGCSTPPKPRGFELPPALREIYRGGELAPMQNAESPDLGMRRRGPNGEYVPTNYDLVTHTCHSYPIFNLDGSYAKTITRCF